MFLSCRQFFRQLLWHKIHHHNCRNIGKKLGLVMRGDGLKIGVSCLDTLLQCTKIICRFHLSLNSSMNVLGLLDGIFAHQKYILCIYGIVTSSKLLLDPNVFDQLSNSERKDFSTGIDSQIECLDSSIIRYMSLSCFIIAVSSSGLLIYMGWHLLLLFSNFLIEKVKTQSE